MVLFLSFLATAASWRERLQLQDVFSRVLLALNNTDHSLAVVCSVNKVTFTLYSWTYKYKYAPAKLMSHGFRFLRFPKMA